MDLTRKQGMVGWQGMKRALTVIRGGLGLALAGRVGGRDDGDVLLLVHHVVVVDHHVALDHLLEAREEKVSVLVLITKIEL